MKAFDADHLNLEMVLVSGAPVLSLDGNVGPRLAFMCRTVSQPRLGEVAREPECREEHYDCEDS